MDGLPIGKDETADLITPLLAEVGLNLANAINNITVLAMFKPGSDDVLNINYCEISIIKK